MRVEKITSIMVGRHSGKQVRGYRRQPLGLIAYSLKQEAEKIEKWDCAR